MRRFDVHMMTMRGLYRRLARSDDGFTVAELSVTALVGGIALTFLAIFMVNSLKTGIFTEGQVSTINDARNVMQGIEKDVRGAEQIIWCAPVGSCLEVVAQTADGGMRTLRYVHTGTELQRQVFNPDTTTWGALRTVVERVANSGSQPVFACDTQSTFLRVNVDLHIEPTPESNPNFNVNTSVRPRNFGEVASCP